MIGIHTFAIAMGILLGIIIIKLVIYFLNNPYVPQIGESDKGISRGTIMGFFKNLFTSEEERITEIKSRIEKYIFYHTNHAFTQEELQRALGLKGDDEFVTALSRVFKYSGDVGDRRGCWEDKFGFWEDENSETRERARSRRNMRIDDSRYITQHPMNERKYYLSPDNTPFVVRTKSAFNDSYKLVYSHTFTFYLKHPGYMYKFESCGDKEEEGFKENDPRLFRSVRIFDSQHFFYRSEVLKNIRFYFYLLPDFSNISKVTDVLKLPYDIHIKEMADAGEADLAARDEEERKDKELHKYRY